MTETLTTTNTTLFGWAAAQLVRCRQVEAESADALAMAEAVERERLIGAEADGIKALGPNEAAQKQRLSYLVGTAPLVVRARKEHMAAEGALWMAELNLDGLYFEARLDRPERRWL